MSQPGQPLNIRRVPQSLSTGSHRLTGTHHHVRAMTAHQDRPLGSSRPPSATNGRLDRMGGTAANHRNVSNVSNGVGIRPRSITPLATPTASDKPLPGSTQSASLKIRVRQASKPAISSSNGTATTNNSNTTSSGATHSKISNLTRGGPLLSSQKIELLTKELSKSRDRCKSQEHSINSLQSELKNSQRASVSIALCLQHLLSEYKPFDLPTLRNRYENLKKEIELQRGQLFETERIYEEKLTELTGTIELLTNQLGSSQLENESLRTRESSLATEYASAKEELDHARREADYLAKKRNKSLHEANSRLEADNASLKAVLDMKTDKVKMLERNLLRAETDLDELPTLHSSIRHLEQKCEQLECSARAKAERCEEVVKMYYELKKDYERTTTETRRLSKRTEELEYVLNESSDSMTRSLCSRGTPAPKSLEDTPLPLPMPSSSSSMMTRSVTSSLVHSSFGAEPVSQNQSNSSAPRALFTTPCRKSNSFTSSGVRPVPHQHSSGGSKGIGKTSNHQSNQSPRHSHSFNSGKCNSPTNTKRRATGRGSAAVYPSPQRAQSPISSRANLTAASVMSGSFSSSTGKDITKSANLSTSTQSLASNASIGSIGSEPGPSTNSLTSDPRRKASPAPVPIAKDEDDRTPQSLSPSLMLASSSFPDDSIPISYSPTSSPSLMDYSSLSSATQLLVGREPVSPTNIDAPPISNVDDHFSEGNDPHAATFQATDTVSKVSSLLIEPSQKLPPSNPDD